MELVNIDNLLVGKNQAPYVIAEIGSNHNGDMVLCRKIIDAAVDAGASAVKFQSWTPESLISKNEYARNTTYTDKKKHFGSLEEMVRRYAFTPEQHQEIVAYCRSKEIIFLSSAFSIQEVEMLESLNVPAHKVASMDINYYTLLKAIAETKKTVILSTGMATLGEIEAALNVLSQHQSGPVILLHCISIYPPDYSMINLNNIKMLRNAFGLPVGLSDHSTGPTIALAAVALGACMIEKHFTIDKTLPGWDHEISADPAELAVIVREGSHVVKALGSYQRTISQDELDKRIKFRRRAVTKRPLAEGVILTPEDITFKRPGNGIAPDELSYLIGRRLKYAVDIDHELVWEDFVQ